MGSVFHGEVVVGRFPELEADLCGRMARSAAAAALPAVRVVVGSAALAHRLRERMIREVGAVAGVSVLTLAQFVAELAAEESERPPVTLTPIVRERLLRSLVCASVSDLSYLARVSLRPHFARALAATIADLRQAGIDPDGDWWRAVAPSTAAASGDPVGAAGKAADLALLYGEYCRELQRRSLADDASLSSSAAAALRRRVESCGEPDVGRGAEVAGAGPGAIVFYGLYDLNVVQEGVVAAALATGAGLYVPLPRGVDEHRASILSLAVTAGLPVRRLAPPPVSADRDRVALAWQASRLARQSLDVRGDGTLVVVSVPDERSEEREAARAVLEAAQDGASFRDCAVVVPRADDVPRVAAALQAAGLPVACRRPDASVGVRTLRLLAECLAPAYGRPFSRRAVLDLLSSVPLRGVECRSCESALWLDEARRAGVTAGAGQWVERIDRRRRDLEQRASRAGPPPEADEDERSLDDVRLRLAAVRGLQAAVVALCEAAARLPECAGWSTWCRALRELADEVFDVEPAAAVNDVLERMLSLGVLSERVEVATVADVLRELAESARTTVGSIGRDGVAVLTPIEMRGLSFHTVVFTGLAEGGFPVRGRPDAILTDAERRRVAEAEGSRLPLAQERVAESLVLFGFVCEAARERLVLTAPRTDAASGRPRLPSRILLELAGRAAGRPVGLDEFLSGAPLGPVWRRVAGTAASCRGPGGVWLHEAEMDTAILLSLAGARAHGAVKTYLAEVLGGERPAARRLGVWQAARTPVPGPWDGLLGPAARRAFAGLRLLDREMHPTRLERYLGCPFVFYLRDVLQLYVPQEPSDEVEMAPVDLGTLAHAILQRTYQRLIPLWGQGGAGPDVAAALAVLEEAHRDACLEAERRGVTGTPLAWRARRRMLLEDLHDVVAADTVFGRGDGRPVAVEWRFGESAGRPVELMLPGGRRLRFAGRIDRIDETAAGVRIIDYKTGSGLTECDRLKKGLSVQLPVYGVAVRRSGLADDVPVTTSYRFVTRRGGFKEFGPSGDGHSSERSLLSLLRKVADLMDAGLFPRAPAGRCESCDVRYACGVSGWMRDRKLEHAALRAVVDLQRSKQNKKVGCDDE